jgi:hypothetical protein
MNVLTRRGGGKHMDPKGKKLQETGENLKTGRFILCTQEILPL